MRFTTPEVLVVGDLGLRPLSQDEPVDLYEIVRRWYERGSTIITSNHALEEWHPLFGTRSSRALRWTGCFTTPTSRD